MNRIFLAGLLVLIRVSSPAQLIENPPFHTYEEIPHAKLGGFGIGSLGFDAPINTYNPHYQALQGADYRFVFGGNLAVAGHRGYPEPIPESDRFSSPVLPAFGLIYNAGRVAVQLCYYPEYAMNASSSGMSTFYTFENLRAVQSNQRDISIRQNAFQMALSFSIAPAVSFTTGLLTRNFRYVWDIKAMPPVIHAHDLFDEFQLLVGVMARPAEHLQAYLTFTSQNPRVDLSDGGFVFPTGTLVYPGYTQVSYYGNIGYGVQVDILSWFKASIEMRHQFLEDSAGYVLDGRSFFYKKNHIWNNEITLGTHFSFIDRIQAGLRYSTFLKYDSRKWWYVTTANGTPDRMSIGHPYSIGVAAMIILDPFTIEALYQYSRSTYVFGGKTKVADVIHSGSLLIGYSLSLE